MTLKQKISLKIVFVIINLVRFIEIKLITLLKYLSISILTYIFFVFSFNNINKLQYLFYTPNVDMYLQSTNISQSTNVYKNLNLTKVRDLPLTDVTANVILVSNANTDQILYQKNSDLKVPTASTAKLMTALVALDLYKSDDIIKVPYSCTTIDATNVGLVAGAEYSFLNLMHALLLNSGADAACTISNGKTTNTEFIQLMNNKSKHLKMDNSNFTNSIGLDGPNGSNYSTANDLYLLSKEAMKNDIIKNIVNQKQYVIKSIDDTFVHILKNTNELLWENENSAGVKTGETAAAGEVLIYQYQEPMNNKSINIIVVQSLNRFNDTKSLLNWTLGSFE